jgi:hypothetical protein
MLVSSGKIVKVDEKFDADETGSRFVNHVFTRLVAMKIKFTNVNFRYSTFDSCYLRNCQFDSCDFTGCRFLGTQLPGAKFSGCKFEYATFERTLIDSGILDTECPGLENLKSRFARTLRTNFQQLGDMPAVHKAIKVDLSAWQSNESYYRSHHPGFIARTVAFIEWLEFKALDLIWGNGENLLRLIRAVLIVLALMTISDAIYHGDPSRIQTFINSFPRSFEIFFGTLSPPDYNKGYLALITCVRLVAVGFFLSIIIKKFSRR